MALHSAGNLRAPMDRNASEDTTWLKNESILNLLACVGANL